jgi:hypothetical protein
MLSQGSDQALGAAERGLSTGHPARAPAGGDSGLFCKCRLGHRVDKASTVIAYLASTASSGKPRRLAGDPQER